MKANELMIGDWVYTENDTTPRQIDWIRSGEVGLFWNKIVTPPYLKPIPLTPEILEKNGFRLHKFNGDTMRGMWWEIPEFVIRENMLDYIGRNNFEYKYVHQLQHALKLCGIDKTIEL